MGEAVEEISNELLKAVEESQRKAFISDGLKAAENVARVFAVARYRLRYARRTVHAIEDFLRKHREDS